MHFDKITLIKHTNVLLNGFSNSKATEWLMSSPTVSCRGASAGAPGGAKWQYHCLTKV